MKKISLSLVMLTTVAACSYLAAEEHIKTEESAQQVTDNTTIQLVTKSGCIITECPEKEQSIENTQTKETNRHNKKSKSKRRKSRRKQIRQGKKQLRKQRARMQSLEKSVQELAAKLATLEKENNTFKQELAIVKAQAKQNGQLINQELGKHIIGG